MNKLLIPVVSFLLFSCGGNERSDQPANGTEDVTNEEISDSSEVVDVIEEIEYVPENEDGVWQIDDYAEMIKGRKIYKSHDDIPVDEMSSSEYFQELDLRGGFASVTGAYEGWGEFVIWRMEHGGTLLGTMSAGCGPVCSYSFRFYIFNDQNEIVNEDAAEDVLPFRDIDAQKEKLMEKVLIKYPDIEYPEEYSALYKFPRKGTSMSVDLLVGADEIQIPMLELSWDKMSFQVSNYYDDVD